LGTGKVAELEKSSDASEAALAAAKAAAQQQADAGHARVSELVAALAAARADGEAAAQAAAGAADEARGAAAALAQQVRASEAKLVLLQVLAWSRNTDFPESSNTIFAGVRHIAGCTIRAQTGHSQSLALTCISNHFTSNIIHRCTVSTYDHFREQRSP